MTDEDGIHLKFNSAYWAKEMDIKKANSLEWQKSKLPVLFMWDKPWKLCKKYHVHHVLHDMTNQMQLVSLLPCHTFSAKPGLILGVLKVKLQTHKKYFGFFLAILELYRDINNGLLISIPLQKQQWCLSSNKSCPMFQNKLSVSFNKLPLTDTF